MTENYRELAPERPRRAVFPWLIAAALFIFLLGMIANPWFEREVRQHLPFMADEEARAQHEAVAPVAAAQIKPLAQRLHALERRTPAARTGTADAGDLATLSTRLATLEDRMGQLDRQSGAALQNAGRAEGMLLVLAARRAIETGQPLGVIEGMLRDRFGGTQPQAVATLITAAQSPVTLEQLQSEMTTLLPSLQENTDASWIDNLRSGIFNLVRVRQANEPPSRPTDRLAVADAQLQKGNVNIALAQVLRLPPAHRDRAAGWIQKARRYVNARDALDGLETVALLQPAPDTDEVTVPLPATPTEPASNPPSPAAAATAPAAR